MQGSSSEETVMKDLGDAMKLSNDTHDIVMRRFGDSNVLPYLHVSLVFINHMTSFPEAMSHLAPSFPWKLTSLMLNTLVGSVDSYSRIEGSAFPRPQTEELPRPLPEDYTMRGLVFTDNYFPDNWFADNRVDDDEKYLEMLSMAEERKIRVLYLGCRIAAQNSK
jgi:hypothetical protein